ncbi:peroxisomal biogenesis factor 3-like [Homarus americanus]|uniref:Peroxisomal biogenesis factor 3 n=1 Tax=Homarus americanus TaxID=6706 RepID=A0A8J5JYW8_HOMAM|nr:peroxisomal biogenesis factor 3-like [Homarus americanus]KAG7166482.1 Peroxisomal biogenesis factor 3-like [Homarus americanus]
MFARVKDFLYRHRRKFVIGGAIIGGVAVLSRYAEFKLLEWHDQQTRILMEKQKKRQHYENTHRTANATVLSLSLNMKEVISKELDADILLQAVREQPQHKHSIWEQLKIVGFSRAISTVYIASLVASAVRVQLMLLAGYTFGDVIQSCHAGAPISQTLQQKYLSVLHYLVEKGIPKLTSQVTQAVTHIVTGLPLGRPLTLSQLEAIFQEIKLILAGENSSQDDLYERKITKLEPWSRYVFEAPVPPEGDSGEDRILYNMLIETDDIIDSEDFSTVVDTLIQHGFNHLLDRMADFYPLPKSQQGFCGSNENWVDNVSRDILPNVSTSEVDSFPLTQITPTHSTSFSNNSSLPVAKLVPLLSGVVHGALSPTPGQLLQKILTVDKLDSLGANVYEAFALPFGQ